jgi:hypothetical protein
MGTRRIDFDRFLPFRRNLVKGLGTTFFDQVVDSMGEIVGAIMSVLLYAV